MATISYSTYAPGYGPGGTGGTKGLGYRDGSLYPAFDGTDGSNGNAGTIIYLKQ